MSPSDESFRVGVFAVLGRPNVGKSSLVNALVGFKVSIVAPKPQTTRHRILGVLTRDRWQFVFVDTPGLHAAQGRAINRYLNRTARGALVEADAVLLVVEGTRWVAEDAQALEAATATGLPVVLAMNKIDKLKDRKSLLPQLHKLAEKHAFAALVPVSATTRDGLDRLEAALAELLVERDPLFEPDDVTDRSERFLVAELVREQLVRQLHEELPYSTAVEVTEFETDGKTGLLHIAATIWVERDGQKGIVIGARGEQLKRIGTAARKELEKLFEAKVYLELRVNVREGWADDEAALRRFGYGD
jgi:GTP-binding protein Era